jgi:hypothetical protein
VVLPLAVAVALLAFPSLGTWPDVSDRPGRVRAGLRVVPLPHPHRLQAQRRCVPSIWRNHRRHHFKNEHYWFTVTSSGTADRVLGTYPDPATVKTSPTARNLHAAQS